MSDIKDNMGIKENVHIVLTSPDGKVKDERKPRKQKIIKEERYVTGERPRTSR